MPVASSLPVVAGASCCQVPVAVIYVVIYIGYYRYIVIYVICYVVGYLLQLVMPALRYLARLSLHSFYIAFTFVIVARLSRCVVELVRCLLVVELRCCWCR